MTLSHINSFDTDNPQKLSRQLSDLEDNVSAELDRVRAGAVPIPIVASFSATASRGIVALLPDQQLTIDTSIASAAAVLPPLTPANFGRKFLVVKRVGTNSIVTSCQDATVLCNGGAFPTITAIGITTFCCDSSGYYR